MSGSRIVSGNSVSDAPTPLIEMRGIVKHFPGVTALDGVDFQLLPGETHMLLGENGAGKSTLIKVLSGAYLADAGEIRVQGEKVTVTSPADVLDRGLRFIYQEVNLIPQLDIAKNMFLGMEPMSWRGLGIVDKRTLYDRANRFLSEFHINLDAREVVGRLSVTQQKMVEIARAALVSQAKAIILDEPTDVLEDRSRNDLFHVMGELKKKGVGFIYISHRYAEVHEMGDRVTILRDGRNIGTYNISDLTLDGMIQKMIGREVTRQYPELPPASAEEGLRVENLRQGKRLNGISFEVKRGEIVCLTGLMGAGKTELARAVAGIDRVDDGSVSVHGRRLRGGSVGEAIKAGISYLTEDRKTLGLILDHSLRDNYAVPNTRRLSRRLFLRHRQINRETAEMVARLRIKTPSIFSLARQMSGGNQQKVVIAKWLGTDSKVLIFDEPTRGIDINGRAEVYKIITELCARGVAVVIATSDYTEALEMGHRVLVLHRGRVAAEFRRGEADEEKILRIAVGAG